MQVLVTAKLQVRPQNSMLYQSEKLNQWKERNKDSVQANARWVVFFSDFYVVLFQTHLLIDKFPD